MIDNNTKTKFVNKILLMIAFESMKSPDLKPPRSYYTNYYIINFDHSN